MSDKPDLSVLMQMMQDKNMNLSAVMEQMNENIKSTNDSSSSQNNSSSTPDMETMMKAMKLMSSLNSSNASASTNLLYALKPFLRDSKKEKIDQYANFLKMSTILNEMNKSGGEQK